MSYFQLPSLPYNNNIILSLNESSPNNDNNSAIIINKTLVIYLKKIKSDIENYSNEWDNYKKFINPYEYIHTNVPNSNMSVSKHKPLSRSYYKMIEVCYLLDIVKDLPKTCNTFHLAEGPGGFIEALCYMRKNKSDCYIGMTLIDNDVNVPCWKKSQNFLKNNKNVFIENGRDNTGDIMKKTNLLYCFEKYGNSMDLITGDGGFDFSIDFNKQETISSKIIFSQIAFTVAIQKKGGSCILKFFDTFTKISVDMIHILSLLYKEVFFVKPNTSRYANSEKYIICKNYRLNDSKNLVNAFADIMDNFDNIELESILNLDYPSFYLNKIEEFNAIFGQQQIETIAQTLNLINNKKNMENMKKNHIQKSIIWCQKHNIPFNNF
jgi:23S rRNA U2552 (ribose-2'-O)-methylase RlmE/FtsJ